MDEDELMEDELRCPFCGKKAQDGCEHIIYAYDGVNNELTDYSGEWRNARHLR
ncbi:MAG: hypothetical protein KBS46_03330 [Clostridiales bacterium]|nr:hypothetical protein [Candidatus Apopatocola equi]